MGHSTNLIASLELANRIHRTPQTAEALKKAVESEDRIWLEEKEIFQRYEAAQNRKARFVSVQAIPTGEEKFRCLSCMRLLRLLRGERGWCRACRRENLDA